MRRLGPIGIGFIALTTLSCASSGCGLSAVGPAATAPLAALSATDTVAETNLSDVVQASGQAGGLANIGITQGPSTNYTEISESTRPGLVVYVTFNQLDKHCLGIIDITAPGAAVLGETAPGTYDFWQLSGTTSGCDAATFAALPTVPAGWPASDPASSWPLV